MFRLETKIILYLDSVQQIEKIVGSDIGIHAEYFEIVLAGRVEADGNAVEVFAELPGYIVESMYLFIWPSFLAAFACTAFNASACAGVPYGLSLSRKDRQDAYQRNDESFHNRHK